jgi:hypothetical protein
MNVATMKDLHYVEMAASGHERDDAAFRRGEDPYTGSSDDDDLVEVGMAPSGHERGDMTSHVATVRAECVSRWLRQAMNVTMGRLRIVGARGRACRDGSVRP